jgi:5-methylcytosine-specific restriction endonuclease McrA
MNDVLVLNSTYEPLNQTTLRRAMSLIFQRKAEIVKARGKVHTITMSFEMPTVIRILFYIKTRRNAVSFTKDNLLRRDNYTCQYCGTYGTKMTVEHVIPRSKGGSDGWRNTVTACDPCNTHKANRTPEEAGMTLMRQPRAPHYISWINLKVGVPSDWHAYFFDASIEERVSST